MSSNPNRISDEQRQAALSELRRRAEEIREGVRVHVLSAGNLRRATEAGNETAEDVAQAAFLSLWAVIREGDPDAIRDLKAYAKKIADNHVASLMRRPSVRRIETADPDRIERLAADLDVWRVPEGVVEQRVSQAQVDSIVASLTPKQALLLKMRAELGMSVAEMARVVGISRKSCEKQLDRATDLIKERLAELDDLDAADRRRLSRVMAVKRWGTPTLVAALQRDMRGDLRLASLWRQSNGALHDVAGAVAIDESLSRLGHGPRLADRAIGLADRAREVVLSAVGRAGPEQEAAAGAAAGGASLATKAIVAACIAGPAAGGACVATGVVELPEPDRAPSDTTVVETTETTPTVTAPTPTAPEQPTPTEEAEPEPPRDPVNEELGLGGTGTGTGSSGTRDFAAPVEGSSGGGGGGNAAGASAFNFEK